VGKTEKVKWRIDSASSECVGGATTVRGAAVLRPVAGGSAA
jgi:hypothetical protein